MLLSAPLLLAAAAISLIVSLVQTLTSVQEQTLTAVPRLVTVFVVAMVAMPWMIHHLVGYTERRLINWAISTGTWDEDLEMGAYVTAAVLVAVRLSGLMVFAPVFSSAAIAPAHQGWVCSRR